jgi:hypothetical protein
MTKLSFATRQVSQFLEESGQQGVSFDTIAAHCFIERRTAIIAVQRLVGQGRFVKIPGSGRVPNRYFKRPEHPVGVGGHDSS